MKCSEPKPEARLFCAVVWSYMSISPFQLAVVLATKSL
jgi:hypothetical protein